MRNLDLNLNQAFRSITANIRKEGMTKNENSYSIILRKLNPSFLEIKRSNKWGIFLKTKKNGILFKNLINGHVHNFQSFDLQLQHILCFSLTTNKFYLHIFK